MQKRLLLISNSTNYGERYLAYTRKYISEFLGKDVRNIAFVPYAAVDISYIEYTNQVNDVFSELGYSVKSTEDIQGPQKVIEDSDAIVIGGGNTFHLIHHMHEKGLMDIIVKKVESGTPFIGWSAGSNVACPTIKTTNDMPVIQPKSFDALSLVPFQINPHYTDGRIPNYNGESREDRIREFLELNPEMIVVGLKESSMLQIEGETVKLLGNKTLKVFRKDQPTLEYDPSTSLDFILK
ncbi:MAG: dipeptidase PepE [Bacteroidales bacterium]|nr:dipeptidase PepE [Bacteroidales bacterium]